MYNATLHTWNMSSRFHPLLTRWKIAAPDRKPGTFASDQVKITWKQVLKFTKRTSRDVNRTRVGRTLHVCWSSQQPAPLQPPRVQRHLLLGFSLTSTLSALPLSPEFSLREPLQENRIDFGFQTLVSRELPKQLEDFMWMVIVHTQAHKK